MMFAYLLLTGYSLHLCREINLDDELSTTRAKKEAEIDQELAAGPADIKNWGVALLAGVMEISLIQCLNTFLRYVAVAVHSPSPTQQSFVAYVGKLLTDCVCPDFSAGTANSSSRCTD
eukprot:COSAG01_NODE_41_length_32446_cov_41.218877_7_plen_118_part_00